MQSEHIYILKCTGDYHISYSIGTYQDLKSFYKRVLAQRNNEATLVSVNCRERLFTLRNAQPTTPREGLAEVAKRKAIPDWSGLCTTLFCVFCAYADCIVTLLYQRKSATA